MPTFSYTALKRDGSVTTGDMAANDRSEAMRKLERNALQPVSVKEKMDAGGGKEVKLAKVVKVDNKAQKAALEEKANQSVQRAERDAAVKATAAKKGDPIAEAKAAKAAAKAAKGPDPLTMKPVKLTRQQVVMLTEELSDLLGGGVQLEPALRIMESRDELSALKDVTIMLRARIRDGTSFAQALRECSPSFGDLYCNMAQAGEVSGALPKILKRQAEYLTSIGELQAKVKTAMIYPVILLVIGTVVGGLFVSNLIPQLSTLLKSMGREMPLPAVIISNITGFFGTWWWAVVLLVVGAYYGFMHLVSLPKYKEPWHKKQLDLPVAGPLLRTRFYVQFVETLSNLVGNGLPLLRSLELTRDATVNLHLKRLLGQVSGWVGEGSSLSKALKRTNFFPSLLTDLVAVGEQTGDLEKSLERTANRYDRELQTVIDRVTALLQPVMVCAMAVLVGTMLYMMISIIMDTMSSMQRR